jgi:hypothetical protein
MHNITYAGGLVRRADLAPKADETNRECEERIGKGCCADQRHRRVRNHGIKRAGTRARAVERFRRL